jgi:hypothetical protein
MRDQLINQPDMPTNPRHNSTTKVISSRYLGALLAILFGAAAFASRPSVNDRDRVRLAPHFVVGQVLDYQIEMRNVTKGRTTGMVQDPEAASQLSQSTSLVVRLEVLNLESAAGNDAPKVRIRATCLHASVTNESDAYDEQAEAIAQQYHKLEGHTLEFGLDADGRVSEVTGLEGVIQDPATLASVRGWLGNISAGARFPKKGIVMGEKWHTEEPVPGAPLRETVWRADSSYLRNESCRNAGGGDPAEEKSVKPRMDIPSTTDNQDLCAVILTQFQILQANPHGDLTPADYLHNGLRTSGVWTGSGESMNFVSLQTGLLVSATQNVDQDLNFTISSATATSSKLNYTGNVKSQSHIMLLQPANKN